MIKQYLTTIAITAILTYAVPYFLTHPIEFKKGEYEPNDIITGNQTRPIEELKKLVVEKGDTVAYEELSIAYLNNHFYQEEYVLYSLIMANVYNYSNAYIDIYSYLTSIYEFNPEIGKIDRKTKNLTMMYLNKAFELNIPRAIYIMGELYMEGIYVPKDTLLGKKLIEKSDYINNIKVEVIP